MCKCQFIKSVEKAEFVSFFSYLLKFSESSDLQSFITSFRTLVCSLFFKGDVPTDAYYNQ